MNGGDLIQFVQNYFNIDFLSAMERINIDFNLKIPENKKINKKELDRIERERQLKKEKKEKERAIKTNKLLSICKELNILENTYKNLKEEINPYNWEEIEEVCSYIWEKIEELDVEFEILNIKSDIY